MNRKNLLSRRQQYFVDHSHTWHEYYYKWKTPVLTCILAGAIAFNCEWLIAVTLIIIFMGME